MNTGLAAVKTVTPYDQDAASQLSIDSLYRDMLQVPKNLSQANGECQFSPLGIEVMDKTDRSLLELPKFVRGLSLDTTRYNHNQPTLQR